MYKSSLLSDEMSELPMKWKFQILINLLIGRSYLSLILLLLLQQVIRNDEVLYQNYRDPNNILS